MLCCLATLLSSPTTVETKSFGHPTSFVKIGVVDSTRANHFSTKIFHTKKITSRSCSCETNLDVGDPCCIIVSLILSIFISFACLPQPPPSFTNRGVYVLAARERSPRKKMLTQNTSGPRLPRTLALLSLCCCWDVCSTRYTVVVLFIQFNFNLHETLHFLCALFSSSGFRAHQHLRQWSFLAPPLSLFSQNLYAFTWVVHRRGQLKCSARTFLQMIRSVKVARPFPRDKLTLLNLCPTGDVIKESRPFLCQRNLLPPIYFPLPSLSLSPSSPFF